MDDLITCQETCAALEVEVETLRSEMATLRQARSTIQSELSVLRKTLQDSLDSLNSGMSAGEKTTAQAAIVAARDSITVKEAELVTAAANTNAKRAEMQTKTNELETAQATHADMIAALPS